MKKNKFKIVCPSRNNEDWAKIHINSILSQTYKNYDVLYIDDCSTDNTNALVTNMTRNISNFKIKKNNTNMKRGYNIAPTNIQWFMEDDEDILVFVDGDDWLANDKVLEQLNDFYNENDSWMTYGGMVCWEGGNKTSYPFPQNTEYPKKVHINNLYRYDTWRASHLRTFKWFLYSKIKDKDLKFSKTGQYYFQAQDLATSFPCLEMCPMNKIGITRFVTYVFNESDKCKKRTVDRIKAAGGTIQNGISELEIEIRHSRLPYKEISNIKSKPFITTILAGGIGNLLFEISAAYSLSLDNNVNMKFSYNHGTPLQGTNIKQYMNNIFRNINFDKDFNENNYPKYKQLGYEYNKIPYDKSTNLCLDGYFQSEKFFKHNEKAIRELFTLPETDLYYINNKYELLLKKPNVSMHIRRGDYLSLKDHYVPLDDNYYNKALSMFDYIEHVLIFSDDIEWCKQKYDDGKGRFIFIEEDKDYIELFLMSMCDNHIIANSSFSWWGSWLNYNSSKKVIAPKKWFGPAKGKRNMDDLIPKEWTIIDW